ncbi:acyltransferase family protein [Bifidobacterium angulatum]|uniref:acyltransferase family protein n=1 Tax=Bifidobacterium angulatum TaxID=1683 RepID=UPI003219B2BC
MRGKVSRQSGIELLRIIAVTLITAHHLVVHSGYALFDEPISVRRLFFQMCIMPLGKIGITLFLLISLWFLVDREQTVAKSCRRIWLLERELLFWGFAGLVVQYIDNPKSVDVDAWLNAIFPVARNEWWYATSYAILLLLLPFLLMGLRKIERLNHKKLCIVLLGLWGVLNLVPGAYLDIYVNVTGFIYVTVLFTYYKWYMTPISNKCAVLLTVIGGLIIFGWNLMLSLIWQFCNADPNQILTYINPVQKEWSLPILAVSFGVFILFTRVRFSSRVVNRCAQSAFAVYLITEQHYFRDEILWKYINLGSFYHSRYAIAISLMVVVSIVVAAILVDFVRQFIFWCTIDRHKGRFFEWSWGRARKIVDNLMTSHVEHKRLNKE